MTEPVGTWQKLAQAATAPRDASGLAVFRVFFGLIISWSALRFFVNDWIDQFFTTPTYFFSFWATPFITAPSSFAIHAIFAALVASGLLVALGLFYRPAVFITAALFTYVELIDVTNYLNHYYLVSLLSALMCFIPANAKWSLDAKLFEHTASEHIPAAAYWILRFQLCCVYFWAGMAKFGSDWLLGAQPMNIWMLSRRETWLIGGLLEHWWAALAMSWAGFLYDTTIWLFLLIKRTRPLAYVAVVVFHLTTGELFNIGLFPYIMIFCTTIFFAPDWPRRLLGRPQAASAHSTSKSSWHKALWALAACYCAIQVLLPTRHFFYPSNVLWSEEGMRWSWKVMLREKNGAITYRVRVPGKKNEMHVPPTRYLTDHQSREFSGQPDMILQLAHDIGRDYEERFGGPVEVRVDALVSLNGRKPQLMIDPTVDLMHVSDSLRHAPWILPGPTEPPPKFGRR